MLPHSNFRRTDFTTSRATHLPRLAPKSAPTRLPVFLQISDYSARSATSVLVAESMRS